MRTWSKTIFQDEPGGRLQSRLRGSLGARNWNKTRNVRWGRIFASTAEIGANAHECLYFSTSFTFIKTLHRPMFFFVNHLGFSLSPLGLFPNWQWVRDKNYSCVVSAKIHFLGTNPPTQIQEVCQRHLSKTNSHLHQMQAISPRRQESRKFSSPKRTPTRHSAAKDFSVWRQAFIMAPKTGSKKLVETWRP